MSRVKVAFIDDGVNLGYSQIEGVNLYSYEVRNNSVMRFNTKYVCESKYKKRNASHATKCLCVFSSFLNPKYYEVHSIKIIDRETGTASIEKLKSALRWCLRNNIKLINMSIGTTFYKDYLKINLLIKRLRKKNTIIVAAANNNNIITYPASLPEVIGVRQDEKGNLKKKEYYFSNNDIRGIDIISCCNYDNLNNINIIPCNSYATPYISALVCKILYEEGCSTFEEVKDLLKKRSVNRNEFDMYNMIKKSIVTWLDSTEAINIAVLNLTSYNIEKLEEILVEYFRKEEYNAVGLFNNSTTNYSYIFSLNKWKFKYKKSTEDIILMICNITKADIVFYDFEGYKVDLMDCIVVFTNKDYYEDVMKNIPKHKIIFVKLEEDFNNKLNNYGKQIFLDITKCFS